MRATCPTHRFLLHLVILMARDECRTVSFFIMYCPSAASCLFSRMFRCRPPRPTPIRGTFLTSTAAWSVNVVQDDALGTWHYRQHVDWALPTQHLQILCQISRLFSFFIGTLARCLSGTTACISLNVTEIVVRTAFLVAKLRKSSDFWALLYVTIVSHKGHSRWPKVGMSNKQQDR
jgi:hypothetical protein